MTSIHLDKVSYCNLVDAFLNYSSPTATLSISGTVADGATANFTTTISVSKTKSIADVYATNNNTGKRMSLIAGSIHNPYQHVSTETDSCSVTYSGGVLTITLSIDNFTGGPITLTSQTWSIVAILKEVAYSS